jgi:adenine-specific DNA-methyltransferase
LCFAKNINSDIFFNGIDIDDFERYRYKDDYFNTRGKFQLVKLSSASIQYSNSLDYPIEAPDGTLIYPKDNSNKNKSCWRWSRSKYEWSLKNDFIVIQKDKNGKWQVYSKQYTNSDNEGNIFERKKKPTGIISKYSSTQASSSLFNLFKEKIFDYPKPYELIIWLINRFKMDHNALVLDFFSGSATTAHAVMQLNAEDGGNRKFIMVQLPEKTSDDSEAFKAGYMNICEIGKERIRRSGELVKKDLIEKNAKLGKDEDKVDPSKLDIGFKVFKLEESNFKEWDSSKEPTIEQLELFADPIKEGKSEEDVLYEVLLKYGVFDQEVKKIKINKKDVYSISDNYLIVMLSNKITPEDVEEIKKLKPKIVVFRDSGFNGNDTIKINAFYTLTKSGVEEVKSV